MNFQGQLISDKHKVRHSRNQTKQHREICSGLGRCSLCNCPGFKGNGNICEDCGHRYDEHDTKWLNR